jgi:hypothetical protein
LSIIVQYGPLISSTSFRGVFERKGPGAQRAARDDALDTFEAVARNWHDTMREQWQPQTAANILHRLEVDFFSEARRNAYPTITSRDLLRAVRQIEQRGAMEIAKRTMANLSRIFVFASHSGHVDRNPAAMLTVSFRCKSTG